MLIGATSALTAEASTDYWSGRLEEALLKGEGQENVPLRQMYLELAGHYRLMLAMCQVPLRSGTV